MSAYCNNCGAALPQAARFCSVCGTVVNGAPPPGFGQGYQTGFQPGYPPYPPRLVRPIFGRQFAGVCIGLARTYGWDVAMVRVLAVLGGVFLFPIVEIAYIAFWIGIPEELPGDTTVGQTPPAPPQP
jgi:phage shock protein C